MGIEVKLWQIKLLINICVVLKLIKISDVIIEIKFLKLIKIVIVMNQITIQIIIIYTVLSHLIKILNILI